ncbi:hypothetical protein FBU59_007048 [Linderina macrospora]|uniref:Uncharacterized protein n=1 Tax=Linderina macrospora TaxID=4868 RepID=A0ACC1IYF8_9FUNG|nr:hypothetical protein FBU59_007048 [Linderina macrospora]
MPTRSALEDSLFIHEDSDLDGDDDDDVTGEESSDNESSADEDDEDVHTNSQMSERPEEPKSMTHAKPTDKTPAPRAEMVADLTVKTTAPVRHVRWNSTGTLLVSSGDDGVTRIWRMAINGTWRESAAISAEKGSATSN